ncbi:energy-coupling factor transporter ATPase [Serpentinicella alkaliphila]|uniref:Energy-coupling factor transporter ATP-binding protein EcfA2 n=1 Tax=Serpentinicella alkaliphila TaxID=1734049 RepID=A0A4R2TVE7_9FIRM|nr:energy-coupling factor transporter ATPase [Serpentinicella alkaliphila]QUH25469.1 energy-coupling factor transporter ATPase [Serpentinicella alkaliphila]TCQ01609.1 energy-coupling factor transport system ATP-binding protein [Serpentinicella alkaliphila]
MSIKIENLTHIYNPKSPFETKALDNINLQIESGEFIGLIGHTGSGKSTLIQHLNGLLKSTEGKVIINGLDITNKDTKLSDIRKKVGLVFQYPEYQLFEETIFKDIAFGPTNLNLSEEEIEKRVKESMQQVNLDFEELKDRSPFELSGGQKRRVAIAGILAMKPEILILDEPTAGLDPKGRDEILEQINSLHKENNITIILVSHSMEDIARYVNRIIVMHKSKVVLTGPPKEIFKEYEMLEGIGLGVPQVTDLTKKLLDNGIELNNEIITVEEAKQEILKWIRRKNNA